MTHRPAPGAVSHVELISKDPAQSIRFYERVFGWKFDDAGGGYWLTTSPGLPTGALRAPQDVELPGSLSYIEVKDLSKTLRDAETAGAKIVVPKTAIPNMGHYAVFVAPGGVAQGVVQSA